VFVFLDALLNRNSRICLWGLGVTLTWAALVRPEGWILMVAVWMALLVAGRPRNAAFVGLMSGGMLALWLVRDVLATGSISGYSGIWGDSLAQLRGGFVPLARSAWHQLEATFVDLLLAAPLPAGALRRVMASAGAILLCRGLVRFENRAEGSALMVAVGVYAALHAVLHFAWLAVDPHYLWVLLPFLATALAYAWNAERPASRGMAAAVAAAVFFLYARQDVYALSEAWEKPAAHELPRSTFDWISARLAPDAMILAPDAPALTLYTHRYSTALIRSIGPEEFRYKLGRLGVTHILTTPMEILYVQTSANRDPAALWQRYRRWIAQDPAAYPLAHDAVNAQLYGFVADRRFAGAYTILTQALPEFGAGRWDAGFHLLDQSLAQFPVVDAMSLYGAAALASGQRQERARRLLEEAVRRQPDRVIAMINLARLSARQHDRRDAEEWYAQAESVIARTGESADLLPVIARERERR
ncbi:MAG TPA: hypothetical protein VMU17_05410, partial [Elusimicrobiota bacterium]|nr:hypothetical protein [Elusimicrobiota bacterium]